MRRAQKQTTMEQARILIEELGTLMGKTDTQSAQRRSEIATWFKDNSTPENDALFDEFINNGVGQIADDLENIRLKLEAEEYKLLPLSYIATHYFGKSRAWLYQRVNGMKVRGHRYTLNKEQRATFNAAVQDISRRIGSICI